MGRRPAVRPVQAALRQGDPIEQVKKSLLARHAIVARQQIAGFYTAKFASLRTLITYRKRFARRKNPIPGLKKEQCEFYTANFANFCRPFAPLNRFPRRKNLSNSSGTRLVRECRNNRGNVHSVTTSHLFWPNQRRRTGWLLPIWLRISDIIGRQYDQEAERGGRGGQRDVSAKMP